jgi:hypothetical protein
LNRRSGLAPEEAKPSFSPSKNAQVDAGNGRHGRCHALDACGFMGMGPAILGKLSES